ncbi:hypothetical protein DFS21_10719 [Pseudomonas sp. 2848]|uniref:hypothetical protein n=1 Tax=Pseudomonas sp. 2848 TaxID=2183926 RepID=UPI000DB49B92|nr:hypothetical protein [Pseudomonas sp. 2848]PZW79121.1 hypothetical protein DFS21_10719 [Pseudomonas sp. 2848]
MSLDSTETQSLLHQIRDSFRVRENDRPIYLDIGGDHFRRVSSPQHQVIFGRRGSGKSCLFVYCMNQSKEAGENNFIYVGMDQFKTLKFPDILTSILIDIFSQLPGAKKKWWWPFSTNKIQAALSELEKTLDTAFEESIEEESRKKNSGKGTFKPKDSLIEFGAEASNELSVKSKFSRQKQDFLERHLSQYKRAIKEAVPTRDHAINILLDDYYLVNNSLQPDVIDYLHRLFRDTNLYLKIGTIRHRTKLRRYENQTIGVELNQDIEEINLDKTLDTLRQTQDYLVAILDEMGRTLGINSVSGNLFNADAAHALTLASGGVPRDFLTIFVEAVSLSVSSGKTDRLTPTYIYKAAASQAIPNKRRNLSEDAGVTDAPALEAAFADIISFCLKEKKKTAFLVSSDDVHAMAAEHEMLQQLVDFKLIHLIDQNTSAASGRAGRYSAYTLDAALFMAPRKRNIEIVEFWLQDAHRGSKGVRESPIYPLQRIKLNQQNIELEAVLGEVEELPSEPETA